MSRFVGKKIGGPFANCIVVVGKLQLLLNFKPSMMLSSEQSALLPFAKHNFIMKQLEQEDLERNSSNVREDFQFSLPYLCLYSVVTKQEDSACSITNY